VLALLLVAGSLGLSNFAAAIGIGVSGIDARTPAARRNSIPASSRPGCRCRACRWATAWQARSGMPPAGSAPPCRSPGHGMRAQGLAV